jgi:hypothetical protein
VCCSIDAVNSNNRLLGLDTLRASLMFLGVVLHAALAYTDSAWIVIDQPMNQYLRLIVPAIHSFRMPLFFLIAGFFTAMLWKRHGKNKMLSERAKRIALPLILACFTLLPVQFAVMKWARSTGGIKLAEKSAVWLAIMSPETTSVQVMIDEGVNINTLEPSLGLSPLSMAIITGKEIIVSELLKAQADPNLKNRDGNRPLHVAAFLGRTEITKELLKSGANRNLLGANGTHVTQTIKADRPTTEAIVQSLNIPLNWSQISEGRTTVQPLLGPEVTSGSTTSPQISPTSSAIKFLQDMPLFHHLWFLWHLCWIITLFWLISPLIERSQFVTKPIHPLWLAPAVIISALLMTQMNQDIGIDTSTGLLPTPRVIGLYTIFFFTGVWFFVSESIEHLTKFRWVSLLLGTISLLGVLLSGTEVTSSMPIKVMLETLAMWGISLGLFSVAYITSSKEKHGWRFLADSAFFVYLAHLPLVVAGQGLLTQYNLQPELKALMLIIVTTSLLLLGYRLCVRYTWLGFLLNGKKFQTKT